MQVNGTFKIMTRNQFKMSYNLTTAFQLNIADFSALSSKSGSNTISDRAKVPASKLITNLIATFVRLYVLCQCLS